MERLTMRLDDGRAVMRCEGCKEGWNGVAGEGCTAMYCRNMCKDRLAAYEDTGLEPEICAEYKKFEDEIVASGKTFNHLIELLRAEKEGRVVVVPGPDTHAVVQCRSCEHSYESVGGLYCAFGPCVDCRVPYEFFCANGRYKRNAGGRVK